MDALSNVNAEITSSAPQVENSLSTLQSQQVNLALHKAAVTRRRSQEFNSKASVSAHQIIVPETLQIYPRRWPPRSFRLLHLSESY
jgi:hypothetical protein